MISFLRRNFALILLAALYLWPTASSAQLLDRQKVLVRETFWDNRDWDWYQENIPFFECPDADIQTTYYYRWELLTKHLTYGSPESGYTFTEFIDRPFWSGAYGAISCPAGHQLYEARWLRHPKIPRDFARYWFHTPGAQPRRYSTWLADAIWSLHEVHPDGALVAALLPDLVKNYEAWEQRHFDPEVGLFWQTGHDDGMEININSRQTADTVRGAPGYRPTLNSYLWADALAIARIARLSGDDQNAEKYRKKAAALKENLQKKLWDPKREFFLQMYKNDEEREGHKIKALTRTYQSGRYAGSPHGRELVGYVPWQFNLPDAGYDAAWKFLMDRDYFFADYGPTTVERGDPQFLIADRCCVWSGQSWPYATTQTLKAMANVLQSHQQSVITPEDYIRLLSIFAKTHRKNGHPYIAEACNPDTGSWEGHDSYNHSEHYFHSGYVDLVITGLVGIRPRDDDTIEVHPLVPAAWDYFALDGLPYRHGELGIVWDKTGARYGLGAGLRIVAGGQTIAQRDKLGPITAKLPSWNEAAIGSPSPPLYNFAVNNSGRYYPKITASYTAAKASPQKLIDGNYWYHIDPPNRWTAQGTPNKADWLVIDFGIPRKIHEVALYFLDDGGSSRLGPPHAVELETWTGKEWAKVTDAQRRPSQPQGHRANRIRFKPIETERIRVTLAHDAAHSRVSGLSEVETWGTSDSPLPHPREPANLAANRARSDFPKATASFTSRFDKVEMANDGVTSFSAAPHNRWTAYESPNGSDWLAIDLGEPKSVSRVELAIYDDGGGVQAPADYNIEFFDGKDWQPVRNVRKSPALPAGGQYNEATFDAVNTAKLRVVFKHNANSKSGVSEILIRPN